ncbi:hypothetical protein AB4144_67530, partial [Rhizobiaceae sp. 2RAB30]
MPRAINSAKQDSFVEGPAFEQQDWDALRSGRGRPNASDTEGARYSDKNAHGELAEEDDDNPYQKSDEALPDDEEEKV